MALPPELADPRIWSYWLGVLIQFVVAGAVLFLAPHDIRHRTFAILVACNAAWDLTEGFWIVTDGAVAVAHLRAYYIFQTWTTGALAAFLVVYPIRSRHSRAALSAIAAVTLAVTAILLTRPDLHGVQLMGGGAPPGPLALLSLGWFPVLVIAAAAFLVRFARRPADVAPAVVAAAFLVYPAGGALGTFDQSMWARALDGNIYHVVLAIAGLASRTVAFGLAIVAVALALRARKAGLSVVLAVPLALALFWSGVVAVAPGLGAIAFGALTAYALARGRVFDIDLKLKWTLRRGTVAAIFLGVFLIATQIAQNYLQGYGLVVGGIATGLLLIVVQPLQRFADRIAEAAMPGVAATPAYVGGRKLDVYRAALEGALSDGEVTAKERDILTRLQLELGIANAEARAMEDELCARAT